MNDIEWHAWRSKGIGGSDIPCLLNLNSWGSPFTVWADKHGLIPPSPETERQRIGKRAERWLAEEFYAATKLHICGEQSWLHDASVPHRRCTVDGFVDRPDMDGDEWDVEAVWECKTDRRHGMWHDADGVPASIKAQAIWNAGIAGLPGTWLTVLHAGLEIEHIYIPFDPDDWAYMTEVADRFWLENVQAGVMPEMTGIDAETAAIRSVWPESVGTVVEVDPELHVRWSEARDARLDAEKVEQAAANALRAALGDADAGTIAGIVVVTHKSSTPEWVDPRAERMPKPRGLAPIPERARKFYDPEPVRILRPVKTKEEAA